MSLRMNLCLPSSINHSLMTTLCLMCLLVSYFHCSCAQVLNSFPGKSGIGQLRNFIIDTKGDYVYVGAVNIIYRLTTELGQRDALETGPHNDSVNCSPSSAGSCCAGVLPTDQVCPFEKQPTNSVNQALVLDEKHRTLIACGTLYQGSCAKIDLNYFNRMDYVYTPVVPNDENRSVVGFIGHNTVHGDGLLYVGASYSSQGLEQYRNAVKLLSARQLNTFNYSHHSVEILARMRNTYQVRFVHGFQHGNYSNFLVVHRKTLELETPSSFLLRFCNGKTNQLNSSLVEIGLQCSYSGLQYGYLRDAVIAPISRLVTGMDVAGDNALFTVFTESEQPVGKSVICVFRLSDLNTVYQESIKSCFGGTGTRGPEYIVDKAPCIKSVSQCCVLHDWSFRWIPTLI